MGISFQNTAIDELKSRIDIVDVIGRVVPLKRAGGNFKGVCPFHNEKTPSFVVSEQKQIFTCFGCGASGDVIEFVRRYYSLDFNEAVDKLAGEYGITIQRSNSGEDNEKYYQINRAAARFFYRAFTESKNAGYTYMNKRGISDATLKKFGIGYADEKWDSLYSYFKEQGVDEKILIELGLISESKGRYYDRFRNRVMFPIINTSGRVIGFGGRAVGDDSPKYINSQENRVFQKKNNLYALNLTRQDIGKDGYAIMVEGYMDVISLYQGGVHNVAASLGTALTENQIRLIKRYTRNLVLSYDADSAGKGAAMRGSDMLSKADCKVRVLSIAEGKDPDEFIRAYGREAFLELVDHAQPYIDYKLDSAKHGCDLSTEEGKIDYIKAAAGVLGELSPVEADVYIKKLAAELNIAEGAIRLEIMGKGGSAAKARVPENYHDEGEDTGEATPLELNLLKVMLTNPSLTEQLLNYPDIMTSRLGSKAAGIMIELYGMNGDFQYEQVMDRMDPMESEALSRGLESVVLCGNEEQVFADCINTWEMNCLTEREQEIISRLSLADEENNLDAINKLTAELMAVQHDISAHGGRKYGDREQQ